MTAGEILAAAQRAGVRVAFKPPNTLSVDLPAAAEPIWLPLLREHKPEIIAALRQPPSEPCPAGHPAYWWRLRETDPWRCGRCDPDPRAARWHGVTLATLGERQIVLRAPTGDLPAVGEWCRLPGGELGDLLAYTPDGSEALLRLLSPGQPDAPRFSWAEPDGLTPTGRNCRRLA